jgi:hypothetical protein
MPAGMTTRDVHGCASCVAREAVQHAIPHPPPPAGESDKAINDATPCPFLERTGFLILRRIMDAVGHKLVLQQYHVSSVMVVRMSATGPQ